MTIDLQKSQTVDRGIGGQVFHQIIRGRLTELLLVNATTWHFKDLLTVKLRHEGGTETLVDRVSLLRLAQLCDLKNGLPTTGSPNYPGEPDGTNPDRNGLVTINQGISIFVTALTIPLGHITLAGGQVLEVTIDVAPLEAQPNPNGGFLPPQRGKVEILSVARKAKLDTLITYEVTRDLESEQPNVREVYLCGRNNISLFNNAPQASGVYGLPDPMDVQVKIKGDMGDTEAGLNAYSAVTFIYGQITNPSGNLIRLFQDFESLPASIYIKVYGEDAEKSEVLLVCEKSIPHMVTSSLTAQMDVEQKRIENLEQNDPARAKALNQAGVIGKSADIAEAKDNFVSTVPTPTK